MRDAVLAAAHFLAVRCEERLTIGDAADHVGYSPFHLARAFERQLGIPPGQWLAAQRFQRAKRLLLDTDERIVDVCNAVGFASLGTFTTRFTAAVGVSPQRFRRLPGLLAEHPPTPRAVPGACQDGDGTVLGRVRFTDEASAALPSGASVYIGLFSSRAAAGIPIAGALLGRSPEFTLAGVPPGGYWLLACALRGDADPHEQLLPSLSVVGGAPEPVYPGDRRRHDVLLELAPPWTRPVLVALPPLASAAAQDWRSRRRPVSVG